MRPDPTNHVGCGGIENVASAQSRATSACVSDRSQASMYREASRSVSLRSESFDDRSLGRVGEAPFDGSACSLQTARDRRDARSEDGGGVVGGEGEHVAQQQHRALVRRKDLQGGHERQLDRLAADHGGLGAFGLRSRARTVRSTAPLPRRLPRPTVRSTGSTRRALRLMASSDALVAMR